MKIELKVIGKTAFNYLDEGIEIYVKRLKRYCTFTLTILPDVKNAKSLTKQLIKTKEGELILKKLDTTDFLILLDDKGKEFSSKQFSTYLEDKLMPKGKKIVFLVGGAYGFSDAVYQRAQLKISLSKLTFSHQMVRLFFVEQLYRAFSIINHEPYHHE